MPFQPFHEKPVDRRIVLIPDRLDAKGRERFIQRISAAVEQQSRYAKKCDAIIRTIGEPRIEDNRIVIFHEPARFIDPAKVGTKGDLPDVETLWWLSRGILKALGAAAPGAPHGGIMPTSIYQDELGRVKLGDFGIAPCLEEAVGTEARRQIHCDGEKWEFLGEDDARESGWIAPYFAHELLEGTQRLNPKSDQFAAGVTLYLLGVGTHPYGAGLDDPTLMLYFHLEPFSIAEERSEWAAAFERAAQELSTAEDKPILAWGALMQKLLASDPGERFAGAAEAYKHGAAFYPEEWEQAERALGKGAEALEEGDVDAALAEFQAAQEAARLPESWGGPLRRSCEELEAKKDEIGGYRRLKRRLEEGRAALNNVEVDRAREIAEAVLAAEQADDELRAGARELLEYCKEQQDFIQTGADELARAYLQSAKELIERREFDDARTILDGLLSDPATPKARAGQTRQLLNEIGLLEQRIEQQHAELTGAESDLNAGRLDAARQRLEALRAANEMPAEAGVRLNQLLERVQIEQQRRASHVAALDAARTAWERADSDALAEQLAKVPDSVTDPELADMRRDLSERLGTLSNALKEREALRKAADQPDAGLVHAERALQLDPLPQILRDELERERAGLQQQMDERERLRLDQVLDFLQAARVACDELRTQECRRRLEKEILPQEGLPEEIRREAAELSEACERIEKALEQLEYARTHLADADFDGADALLNQMRLTDLPAELTKRRDALRRVVEKTRREARERERRRSAEALEHVEQALKKGELSEAKEGLERIGAANELDDELQTRLAAARKALGELVPVVVLLDELESRLDAGAATEALFERFPELSLSAPRWLAARHQGLRNRLEETAERERRERAARAKDLLDRAESTLNAGDSAGGRALLAEFAQMPAPDEGARERAERLQKSAAALEHWLPRIERLAEMVTREQLSEAVEEIAAMDKQGDVPPNCGQRLEELKRRVAEGADKHRSALDEELADLRRALTEQGRKARRFQKRLGAVADDPLSTPEQREQAQELSAAWENLAGPKRSRMPYFLAGSAAVVILIVIGAYLAGAFRDKPQEPLTPARALASVTGSEAARPPSQEAASEKMPAELHEKVTDEAPRPEAETIVPETEEAQAGKRTVQESDRPRVEPEQVATEPEQAAPSAPAVAEHEASATRDPETPTTTTVPEIEAEPAVDEPIEEAAESREIEIPEEIPVATIEEAADEYIGEVKRQLPPNVILGDVLPAGPDRFQIDAEWEERDLLQFDELKFDESRGRFEPAAEEVAAHFELQIRAFEAARTPLEWEVAAAGAGPAERMRVTFEPAKLEGVTSADRSAGRVNLRGKARLEGDQRAEAGFECETSYADGALQLADAAQPAYETYFKNLIMDKVGDLVREIVKLYEIPESLELRCAAGPPEGGLNLTLSLEGRGGSVWAEFPAVWNSGELRYDFDPERTREALRAGLRDAALSPTLRETLAAAWRALRDAVTPTLEEPRRAYLQRCELLDVAARTPDAGNLWRVPLELSVGAAGETARLLIPAALVIRGGDLAWDANAERAAQAAVAEQLAKLVRSLDEWLEQLAGREQIAPDEFRAALLEATRAKIERYGVPRYVLVDEFVQAPNAEEALTALSAALQTLTVADRRRDAYPTVFVEMYLGRDGVFGLSWQAVADRTDTIVGVERLKVWKVAESADLRKHQDPAAFREIYAADPEAGESMLGAALGIEIQGTGAGSFGVLLAPEGPLWLVRWEQVRLQPRPVRGVELHGTRDPGQITNLRELLRATRDGRNEYAWRRAGIWCVPALAGRWIGPPVQIDDFQLGEIVPGRKPAAARFKNWGRMTFAVITDPLLAGDFGWARFAENVRAEEIGHVFWDRQWGGERWSPTPFTSFSLIQMP